MTIRLLVLAENGSAGTEYRALFEAEGYDVFMSTHLPDTSFTQQLQPDLILLDYCTGPQSEGWSFLRQLKQLRATASIPVLICTEDGQTLQSHAQELTIFDVNVVYKPFDSSDLLAAVRCSIPTRQRLRSIELRRF